MHPHPPRGWRFSALLAALFILGPFSVDTYLSSMPDIAADLGASRLQVQQTLSVYLLCVAAMTVVHGPLSDSLGRRRVLLSAQAVFTAASVGCALAPTIGWLLAFRGLQGLSAGAGFVVGGAVIRDCFGGADAQRLMGRVSMIFALAPVIAPAIGAWIHVAAGWRAVFWFLAALAVLLWALTYFRLPETLPPIARQPFSPGYLRGVYRRAATTPPFLLLAFTQAFSFAGLFLYIAAAPVFMLEHLDSGHERFFSMFAASVAGMFTGSFLAERLAGRLAPGRTVRLGLGLQAAAAAANLAYCALATPALPWAVLPLTLYCTGMYIAKPPVAIAALDHFPQNRGLASAFQAFMQTLLNAAVAGALAPLLSASPLTLAIGLAGATLFSAAFWIAHGRRAHAGEKPRPGPA